MGGGTPVFGCSFPRRDYFHRVRTRLLHRKAVLPRHVSQVSPQCSPSAACGQRRSRTTEFRAEDATSKQICETGMAKNGVSGLDRMGHSGLRIVEVQNVCEIVHVAAGITWGERRKVPPPLNQLQNRGVVEDKRVDGRAGRIAGRKRRRDNNRHAESQQRLSIDDIGVYLIGSLCAWGSDMVEEAAPLIEVDDEQRLDQPGPLLTASKTSYRNLSPSRMSACG